MILPPFLKPGDRIGLFAPARKLSEQEAEATKQLLEAEGFEVVFPPHLFKAQNQFAGSDQDRAADLDYLLMDDSIKACLAFRGGYGSVRILPFLRKSYPTPKWIAGYSDITVLHHWANQQLGWASLHSTMPVDMLKEGDDRTASTQSLIRALLGEPDTLSVGDASAIAEGQLCGGNLSVMYSLLGSNLQTQSEGKILFMEDLDEYLYHVDRMMQAINRSGIGPKAAAWIIGGMNDMNDNAIPFGHNAEEIIQHAHEGNLTPLVFGLEAGHLSLNRTLIMGARYRLENGLFRPLI